MMLISLAWKNIWRNKVRSLVVILAFTVGISAGIFMTAFMAGMVDQRVHAITALEVSHIQVHRPEFRDNNDMNLRITGVDSLLSVVKKDEGVAGASKRLIISGMAASAEMATGVRMVAVDPKQEKGVSEVHQHIVAGSYFEEGKRNSLVISKRLSKKLGVDLKNKLILTFQDTDGNITSGAFRISGLFETDNAGFDESSIFIRFEDACTLTGISTDEAHEVAILMKDEALVDKEVASLTSRWPKLETLSWLKLSPEAASLVSMMEQYMIIFMVIILLALCFGIINTMLMAVMERTREIGMLMAVGMSHSRIFFMIIFETLFLSLTGGLIGLAVGWFSSWYTGTYGLNLSMWAEAFSELGYSALIYPSIDTVTLINTTLLMLVTGLISALYPAYRALKYDPATAIREE